jgi:hypothetical protein
MDPVSVGLGLGHSPALKKHTSFVQKFTLGAFVWLERQDNDPSCAWFSVKQEQCSPQYI